MLLALLFSNIDCDGDFVGDFPDQFEYAIGIGLSMDDMKDKSLMKCRETLTTYISLYDGGIENYDDREKEWDDDKIMLAVNIYDQDGKFLERYDFIKDELVFRPEPTPPNPYE